MSSRRGGGHGGGYAARAEQLALSPDVKLKIRRFDCATCGKETLFRGMKCLTCGVFRKQMRPDGLPATYEQRSGFYHEQHYYVRKTASQLKSDRAAYYARLAEESRQKWEGKK